MNRRMFTTLLVALAVSFISGAALRAHPGHEHKVMGTVTMAAADHVMLKDTEGVNLTFQINADTKFMRAKKAAKAADMKAGMRVVITAVTDDEDEKLIATVIEMGAAPTAK